MFTLTRRPSRHQRAVATAGQHLVVVVANPIDQTAACGELIQAGVAAGARVSVVVVTRGERMPRFSDPATDAFPVELVREMELCQAAMALGVTEVEILGHDRIADVSSEHLTRQLTALLSEMSPDVVVTVDGDGDSRPDQDRRKLAGAVIDATAATQLHVPVRCIPRPI